MAQISTGIQITDMSTKWGLVTVADKNGTVVREYVITAEEAIAVSTINNTVPPGCTPEEWFSGLVTVSQRPCNPGQGVINPDGTLVVNYGVVDVGNRKQISLMQLQPTEYQKVGDVLHVDIAVAAQIDKPFMAVAPELVVP